MTRHKIYLFLDFMGMKRLRTIFPMSRYDSYIFFFSRPKVFTVVIYRFKF